MAQKRPTIPAAIKRKVLTAAGHHCSACGESLTLQLAHIVAFSKTKSHAESNLLCLCANCHSKADLLQWDRLTFLYYKKHPWVARKTVNINLLNDCPRGGEVWIKLSGSLSDFTKMSRDQFQAMLAGFLEIPKKDIRIEGAFEGSIKIRMALPQEAAEALIDAWNLQREKICKAAIGFDIVSIHSATTIEDNENASHEVVATKLERITPEIRRIADQLSERIYVKDSKRRFVFANQATLMAHGVKSLDELSLKQDEDFFDGLHLEFAKQDELEILNGSSEGIVSKIEWETWRGVQGNPGRLTFVVTTKIPIIAKDGSVIGVFGVSREVNQPEDFADCDARFPAKNIGVYIREAQTSGSKSRRMRAWYSDRFLELFPSKSIFGRLNLIHPDDREIVKQFLISISPRTGVVKDEVLMRDTVFRIRDTRSRKKNVVWRWIQAVAYPDPGSSTVLPRIIVAHYDADRGRAEEILGAQVIKKSPLFVFVKDHDMKHRFMNPALLKFFGKSLNEIIGRDDRQLDISEADAQKFEGDDLQVINGGTIVRRLEQLSIRGGAASIDLLTAKVPLPADVFLPSAISNGKSKTTEKNYVLGIAADVTSINSDKQIEHLLSETLFNATLDGVSLKDSHGRFVRVNRSFASFFDLPESAFRGKTASQVLGDHLSPEVIKAIDTEDQYVLETGNELKGQTKREIEIKGKNPVTTLTRKVRLTGAPQCEGPAILAISTDITQALQAESSSWFLPVALRGKPEQPPENKEIGVMFADLRGFTNAMISPDMDQKMLIELLRDWHTHVEELSTKKGFDCLVDKFIGDGVMLLFGAASDSSGDAHRFKCCFEACRFALLMENEFAKISSDWKKRGKHRPIGVPPISLGVGISFGPTLTGCFSHGKGAWKRNHYTSIGTPVNIAARLESVAGKPDHDGSPRPPILVSENVTSILNDGSHPFKFTSPLKNDVLRGFEQANVGFCGLLGEFGNPASNVMKSSQNMSRPPSVM